MRAQRAVPIPSRAGNPFYTPGIDFSDLDRSLHARGILRILNFQMEVQPRWHRRASHTYRAAPHMIRYMTAITPDHPAPSTPPTGQPERPRWSASEAARRCNVGRATIQRALQADRIPGAEYTDNGWRIPLDGLLAAGFHPDRPAPPEQAARDHDRAADTHMTERVRQLEAELTAERARTELERAHRAAAEALAAERAERITDLRMSLRQLTPAEPADTPTPARHAQAPATGKSWKRWFRRQNRPTRAEPS